MKVYVLCKCFADLIPLQMLILYTSLVISQPLDCYPLFSLVETFGGNRTVWKEYDHYYTPHTTQGSYDEEFEFPGWQARFDVSDANTRQLTRVSNRFDDIYP